MNPKADHRGRDRELLEASQMRQRVAAQRLSRLREMVARDPELSAQAAADRMGLAANTVRRMAKELGLKLTPEHMR